MTAIDDRSAARLFAQHAAAEHAEHLRAEQRARRNASQHLAFLDRQIHTCPGCRALVMEPLYARVPHRCPR